MMKMIGFVLLHIKFNSSNFLGKSVLFTIIIAGLSLTFSKISFSSSVNSSLLFNTNKTNSASSIKLILLLTPNFSTISSVSLIPAVSIT